MLVRLITLTVGGQIHFFPLDQLYSFFVVDLFTINNNKKKKELKTVGKKKKN